jgi:hypothetical protein
VHLHHVSSEMTSACGCVASGDTATHSFPKQKRLHYSTVTLYRSEYRNSVLSWTAWERTAQLHRQRPGCVHARTLHSKFPDNICFFHAEWGWGPSLLRADCVLQRQEKSRTSIWIRSHTDGQTRSAYSACTCHTRQRRDMEACAGCTFCVFRVATNHHSLSCCTRG